MDLYKIRSKLSSGTNINDMNLRVTYYSRVSTEHDEQINSLKNQVNHFEEMIKNNKNWIFIDGYVDAGISGTTDYKRDNFMKMIDNARLGLFDLIITKEISRFSRNTLDSIKYTRALLDFGVGVYFYNDNINTILPDSELRLTIMASMAQDEVRRLSERVKFGMQRSIKNGIILGNNLLYGYDKKGNHLIINKDESKVVKRLFTMYAIDKLSLNQIANKFNQEKIETSLNKKWNVTTLSRMISNPKYKGFYCGRKSEVIDYMSKKVKHFSENEWVMYEDRENIPPIIDEYLFNLANERLKLNKWVFGDNYSKSKYALSNKIKCECASTFNRRKMSKNKSEVIWFCPKCKLSIRESELFNIIKSVFTLDKQLLKDLLNNLYAKYSLDNDVNSLKYEIKKIDEKKRQLLELNINKCLSNQEFKIRNDECNEEKKVLENRLKEKRVSSYFKVDNYVDNYLESECFIQELIKNFVDKISMSFKKKDSVNLNIKSRALDGKGETTFEFNRGFDVVGTRRYKFLVSVYINM